MGNLLMSCHNRMRAHRIVLDNAEDTSIRTKVVVESTTDSEGAQYCMHMMVWHINIYYTKWVMY